MSDSRPSRPDTPAAPARPRRERAPGAYLPLSLAARFAVAFFLTIVVMAAMVLFVRGHNTDSSPLVGGAGVQRANLESDALIAEDQAPHTVRLVGRSAPRAAIEGVVRSRMAEQIRLGTISGPLGPVGCHPAGQATRTRRPFACTAVAAGVRYLYAGVVLTGGRQVTLCKRDLPPAGAPAVPVSLRCRS